MTIMAKPARSRRLFASVPIIDGIESEDCATPANTLPLIRDAVIKAAVEAGEGDMVAYLKAQALTHPSAFLTLLGKVMPMQSNAAGPVNLAFSIRFVDCDDPKDEAENNR